MLFPPRARFVTMGQPAVFSGLRRTLSIFHRPHGSEAEQLVGMSGPEGEEIRSWRDGDLWDRKGSVSWFSVMMNSDGLVCVSIRLSLSRSGSR
jgi:hypothetical protein